MAQQFQLRRGSYAQNLLFTGASGEMSLDTETHELRVHDSSTVGGFVLPRKPFDSVADLIACEEASWPEDWIVGAGPYRYKVATPTATDHHLTTEGGVKLYLLKSAGVYIVDGLGVDNSGTEDVSSDVQKLLDTIASEGGGTLWFEGGTYLFNSTAYLPDNLTIASLGRDVAVCKASSSDINIFEGRGTAPVYRLVVTDLGFEGHSGQTIGASQAIRLRGYKDITITRCRFVSFQVAAVIAGVPVTSGTEIYEDFRFIENEVDGGGVNVPFSGCHVYNGYRVWILRNYYTRVARPIDFEQNGSSFVRYVWVEGNSWESCSLASWENPDNPGTYTNTYQGIHFASDGAEGEEESGFSDILIDGNRSSNNVHDDGAGGTSSLNGYEINIHCGSQNGGTNIEVRSHHSEGFTSDGAAPNRAYNFQLCPRIKIGKLYGYDPQSSSLYGVRIRDCEDFTYELLEFIDGDSISWSRAILEQQDSLTTPNKGTRGRIVDSSGNSVLLDAFEHGIRNPLGYSRDQDGGLVVTSTASNNPIMSKTLGQGTLKPGSILKVNASGQFIGVAGNKHIGFRFNGSDIGVWTVAPTDTDGWTLEAEIYVASSEAIFYSCALSGRGSIGFTESDSSGSVTSLTLDSQDYDFDVVAWLADGADTIRVRSIEISIQDPYA